MSEQSSGHLNEQALEFAEAEILPPTKVLKDQVKIHENEDFD